MGELSQNPEESRHDGQTHACLTTRMLRALLLNWLSQCRGKLGRGEEGERLAERYLRREKGMRRLSRNWRNPRDKREEIDLVMQDGQVLVFVEVKTRSSRALVPGFYAIDKRKRAVLRRAIQAYLWRLRNEPPTHRFDVVEVEVPAGGGMSQAIVRHFENVPLNRAVR